MSEKILVFAPKFDTATDYSCGWAEQYIDKIKDIPDREYLSLKEKDATVSNFNQYMPYYDVLVFFDHGIEDSLIGQDATRIVTTKTVGKLSGKKVFTMACLSAVELGAYAYYNGCLEYWGALEPIGFTLIDEQLFGEVYVEGAYQRFIEEKTIEEVMNNMEDHFDTQKIKTSNPWSKIWLERDKNMWVCWHAGNPPQKPKELTWWEKIIELIKEILVAIGIFKSKYSFKID